MLEKYMYVFWNKHNRYHRLIIDNQKNFQYRLINLLIIPALVYIYTLGLGDIDIYLMQLLDYCDFAIIAYNYIFLM